MGNDMLMIFCSHASFLFVKAHNTPLTSHQDNLCPHAAQVTQQYLNQNNFNILPWPSMLADMNPIKHLWDRNEVDTRRQNRRFTRIVDMENAFVQAGQALPQRDVRTLSLSMRSLAHPLLTQSEDTQYIEGIICIFLNCNAH